MMGVDSEFRQKLNQILTQGLPEGLATYIKWIGKNGVRNPPRRGHLSSIRLRGLPPPLPPDYFPTNTSNLGSDSFSNR